jgi:hypothetical protein
MNFLTYNIEDFNSFHQFLHDKYGNVKSIIFILKSYPELLSKISLDNIQEPDNIDSEQQDWIRLCSKFTHPLEKDFFKPYWIPIVKDSLDYFIDLSDDSYPIFETKYFWLKPYKWYKKYLTHNIIELLLAPDDGINIENFKIRIEQQHWDTIQELFKKRKSLGFDGKFK